MKIHEYQARELLRQAGIPVPHGVVVESIEEAAQAYKRVTGDGGGEGGGLAVLKAQVHAGGRGKAGFVKLVRSPEEATEAARFMLTHRMVSPQTPPEGLEVTKLLMAAGVEIAKEFYLAITTDRGTRRNVLIASREGGVEIEKVAHENPAAIIKEPIHPLLGLQAYQARNVAFALGLEGKQVQQAVSIMLNLAKLFQEKDCTLAEINPLVLTSPPPPPAGEGGRGSARPGGGKADAPSAATSNTGRSTSGGQLLAIDAKFSFDDNAAFRHQGPGGIASLADPTEENPAELRAKRFGLSYIALDGTIGCLVNGAGLAMATMDIVKLHGGEPANFLDVGGGASEEAVTEAFSIILSDPQVKGVLVNIFGGIMRCDIIAQGIVNAARNYKNPDGSVGFKVPLVVRLEGTNVEAGRRLLEEARKDIPTMQGAVDLADAARRVTAAVV